MDLTEIISEALSTLSVNKLRTGLAILGIVIGIGSVIALISLGQSSQKSVESQIQSLGSNLLTVIPGGTSTGAVRGAAGGSTTLTLDDAKAIGNSSQVTTVNSVSPELSRRSQVIAGKNNTNTQIIGVYPKYSQIRNITLTTGWFISDADIVAGKKVAVLGPQVVTDLFGEGETPVGQSIRINGQTLRIIGITQSKGGTGLIILTIHCMCRLRPLKNNSLG